MANNTFDILLLLSRPGAGKSEITHHIKNTEIKERKNRFHIGEIDEIDDFPMLWAWFEEDAILKRLGHPRLHTRDGNYFIDNFLWDLLIEKICLEYQKLVRDLPSFHEERTTIVEFARGSEHGGFTRAFKHISKEMAEKMAIMYINVSWSESLRKNRLRFNPHQPDSILEHSLPDEKLEKLYRHVDWKDVTALDPDFIYIQGVQVPYIVFENEDDVTTKRGDKLTNRLETTLNQLWEKYQFIVSE